MTPEHGSESQYRQELQSKRIATPAEPTRLGESIPTFQTPQPSPLRATERDAQLARERAAVDASDRKRAWRSCGLGPLHLDAAERLRDEAKWTVNLSGLASKLGSGFLCAMIGGRGTGKTQLAERLIHHHAMKSVKFSARYCPIVAIFMAIRETFRDGGPTELEAAAEFIRPQMLVIDEAHERSESEWENRILNYIIDQRYSHKKDTLLISNQKPDEFKASIGPSIYSRLTETGGIIPCDWGSFRFPQSRGPAAGRSTALNTES